VRRHHRHPDGPRKLRRLRARQQALAQAMTPELPPEMRPVKPSRRAKMIQQHGEAANEREADRRQASRAEQEAYLRQMGIADRRRAERRRR
jgi:septal ring-binding cell division protein DamX